MERLLRAYGFSSLDQVVAEMVEWDHEDAFLDADGRLCLPDSAPNHFPRTYIEGAELEKLLDHYGVESGDLECLRRRMIFEAAWNPDEVAVEDGRIFVATDPDF